mgnify:FL=1
MTIRRLFLFCLPVLCGHAATYTVTSTEDTDAEGTLRWAIVQANANPGSQIDLADSLGTITLTSSLPLITAAVTIHGGVGNTVSGDDLHRIFFVDAPGSAVTIEGLHLAHGLAKGGNGGDLGGGGLGAGGALFVASGAVTVRSVSFANNSAVGGNGAGLGIGGAVGGGGGLGGNGGTGTLLFGAGGGGGHGGNGGMGGIDGNGGGGGLMGNGGSFGVNNIGAGGGGSVTDGSYGGNGGVEGGGQEIGRAHV